MNDNVVVFNLKCSGCGAPLEISSDIDDFSCSYCGAAQLVKRRGGTVSLSLIGDAIAKVQIGTDKAATELAIKRLRDDLMTLRQAQNAKAAVQVEPFASKQATNVLVMFFTFVISGVALIFGNLWGWLGFALVAYCGYSIWNNEVRITRAINDANNEFSERSKKIEAEITFYVRQIGAVPRATTMAETDLSQLVANDGNGACRS